MYSFDVFDTLITRTVAEPAGIFAVLQELLNTEPAYAGLPRHIRRNFYTLRVHSEELARVTNQARGIEEVTLEDIYAALATSGCLSEEEQRLLCRLEEKAELECGVGIEENISRLKALLKKGERVVLISDMYLSRAVIREMLVKADEIFRDIPLYVSSDYRARKTTGRLYRKVAGEEQIGYADWIHIGNDPVQDGEIPYLLGIETELYHPQGLMDFERRLLNSRPENLFLQCSIGTARRLRGGSAAYRMGVSVAGPLLYGYARWILEESNARGLKRLYFIARDGYLVKKCVDLLLREQEDKPETHYCYGSRRAWRLCSLSAESFDLYSIILWSYPQNIRTLEQLARTLRIERKDLEPFLPWSFRFQETLTGQELKYLVKDLSGRDDFRDWYLGRLTESRRLLRGYLKQELDTSDDSFAFVDVSGSGMTQGCLKRVMEEFYPEPIMTFFFKTDRVNLIEGSACNTYLPNYIRNNLIIEAICRAPHGQTMGYRDNGGIIEPVLDRSEPEAMEGHRFSEYERGILDYVKAMEALPRRIDSEEHLNLIMEYYQMLAQTPDSEILEYFASIPNSTSGEMNRPVEYAPKLSDEELKNIFYLGLGEAAYTGTNLEYSLLRCSDRQRRLMEQYRRESGSAAACMERDKQRRERARLVKRYGNAAFYPIGILKRKLILYGAGRFGVGLYQRLCDMQRYHIVKWVDQNPEACRVPENVTIARPEEIAVAEYDQIVVAILADDVREEAASQLKRMGIEADKIISVRVCEEDITFIPWLEQKGNTEER